MPSPRKTTQNTTAPRRSPAHASNAETPSAHTDRRVRLAALRDTTAAHARGIPDVRGWRVELSDGSLVGIVTRILVDRQADFVPRYLHIVLDPSAFNHAAPSTRNGYEVLVPIGVARLAKGRDLIVLPTVSREQLPMLPLLGDGAISFDDELKAVAVSDRRLRAASADELYLFGAFDVSAFHRQRTLEH